MALHNPSAKSEHVFVWPAGQPANKRGQGNSAAILVVVGGASPYLLLSHSREQNYEHCFGHNSGLLYAEVVTGQAGSEDVPWSGVHVETWGGGHQQPCTVALTRANGVVRVHVCLQVRRGSPFCTDCALLISTAWLLQTAFAPKCIQGKTN